MPFAAYTIQFLIWILYPVVWAFQKLTDLMAPSEREPTVTRSELEVLAQVSRQEGALEEEESLILKNLLKLTGVQVKDVMTPRTVMFSLQEDTTVDEVMQKYAALSYSRIPIYTQSLDDTAKFVLRHDILMAAAEDRDSVAMKELARPLKSVPESLSVAETMQKFMAEKEHVFLVFDEYGGTDGIITLEDTVESLIGSEITDESDVVADLRDLAKKRYKKHSQLAEKTVKTDATGGQLASDATGN